MFIGTRSEVVSPNAVWVGIAGFATFCAFAGESAAQTTKPKNYSISVSSVSGPSNDGKGSGSTVKGTMTFTVNGSTTKRYLNSYGKAGPTSRECPELIKRYAYLIGIPVGTLGKGDNGNSLSSVGNGNQAAQKFASLPSSGFTYVANGSTALPKAGAVISIAGWTGNTPGHVGIAMPYAKPSSSATTVTISIFEQNMPISSWKTVTFTKSKSGTWTGQMRNGKNYPQTVGWANPNY